MKNSNLISKNPIKIENKEWLALAAISAFVLVKVLISIYGNLADFQDSDFPANVFPLESASGIAFEILLTFLAAGCLCLTYLTCAELFGKSPGFFSVLLAIGTLTFFEQSSALPTELFSVFFALAAVYFFVKKRLTFSSATAFAALFFNPLCFLLIPLFVTILFLRRELVKNYLKICLPFVFLLFLALAFGFKLPNVMESFSLERTLSYFPELISQNLFYAFLPIGFFFLLKDLKKDKKSFLLIGYFAIELVISSFKPSGLMNLILPSAIISGYGFYRTLLTRTGTSWKGTLIILIIAVMAVLTLINLASEMLGVLSKRF